MKRIVLILAVITGVLAQGQTLPLLQIGERRADLYYYGSNWIDSCILNNPDEDLFSFIHWGEGTTGNSKWLLVPAYYGRTCVTETPLKIIGIAAPVSINHYIENYGYLFSHPYLDTSVANREPEYFRLYQQEGDSIYFKDEVRWDTNTPQYFFQLY